MQVASSVDPLAPSMASQQHPASSSQLPAITKALCMPPPAQPQTPQQRQQLRYVLVMPSATKRVCDSHTHAQPSLPTPRPPPVLPPVPQHLVPHSRHLWPHPSARTAASAAMTLSTPLQTCWQSLEVHHHRHPRHSSKRTSSSSKQPRHRCKGRLHTQLRPRLQWL